MRRNSTQPEFIFFPSDSIDNKTFDKREKRSRSNITNRESVDFDLMDILKKLMRLTWKLVVALKYQFVKYWRRYVGLQRSEIPWMKLGVLAFLAFIICKDELNMAFDMNAPLEMFVKKENKESSSNEHKAQTISWKGDGGNPYAPASPDMLKDKATLEYIDRFADVAKTEMEKYGIPASIKMAQAIIESRAGDSRLAKSNNNHFGMKCFSKNCKKGHCSNHFDDHHKDFFRKYDSSWESWRSHSKMIVSGRYKPLLKHGRNYKKWADGLKRLGYATDKKYHTKLKAMIEKYELYKLDI